MQGVSPKISELCGMHYALWHFDCIITIHDIGYAQEKKKT